MKRWGVIALMLFAFVAGFTMTYNCGGGSSAEAEGDADSLQGHPASDFALVDHDHDAGDITSGVLDISLIPAHGHPDYALSNHTHDEYMNKVETCSADQILKWNGSAWVCAEDNSTTASTDADTLDGLDSSDFALVTHTHEQFDYFSGTHKVPPSSFQTVDPGAAGWALNQEIYRIYWSGSGTVGYTQNTFAPLTLPFRCRITEVEAILWDNNSHVHFDIVLLKRDLVSDPETSLELGRAGTTDIYASPSTTSVSFSLSESYDPASDWMYFLMLEGIPESASYSVSDLGFYFVRVSYELQNP